MAVEVKVDAERCRLSCAGKLFAGGKTELVFSGISSGTLKLGLFVYDRRLGKRPQGVATRLRPQPCHRCIALSEKEGAKHYLDLDNLDVKEQFDGIECKPGSFFACRAYLWDGATPKIVAEGLANVHWTPVYFTPEKRAVSMKGDPGEKGDAGEDAILTPLTPGVIPKVDATGKHLEPSGLDMNWLGQRVTAYRNASGCLVLTTGSNPTL